MAEELGASPDQVFARWDPRPIAAASIGQVHRAVTLDGRAVAVKVQYPGIAETIAADLRNAALLRRMLRIAAPSQDVDALLGELRDRITEELDYSREAANQRLMAAYYDGHPTIHIPGVIDELSTRRVLTSELSATADWRAHLRGNLALRPRSGRHTAGRSRGRRSADRPAALAGLGGYRRGGRLGDGRIPADPRPSWRLPGRSRRRRQLLEQETVTGDQVRALAQAPSPAAVAAARPESLTTVFY